MDRKDFKGDLSHEMIEEGEQVVLDFEKLSKIAGTGQSVVPAVVQDVDTKEVLLIGYVNNKALKHTIENKVATFWSTSRNELWIKGMTSGDQLEIVDVFVNCEQNSLLYLVKMVGNGSCHTKHADGQTRLGCYYRKVSSDSDNLEFTNK